MHTSTTYNITQVQVMLKTVGTGAILISETLQFPGLAWSLSED
jgi:hypothetical protein